MHQFRKKILPIVLPSMVEAEKFSDHPRMMVHIGSTVLDTVHCRSISDI